MVEIQAMADARSSTAAGDDWDRHWAAYAETNALNPAQAYRRELIFDRLALGQAAGSARVLDVGSGQGELSREIRRRHPEVEVTGIDRSTTGLEVARGTVPGARFLEQDLMRPLARSELAGWATHAICTEVLEHLPDPEQALRNVRAALAPGCRLVITVPSGPMSAFDKHIGHLRHFSAAALAETLRAAGFRVVEMNRAGFPFFNLYRLTVIARGKKLIDDAAAGDGRAPPLAARLAMRAFAWLFRFNRARTDWGWQLVAIATPEDTA
jgi:2-polyprenyl-3-methyl-5-hydroxy-6-metoxy-1,4-benzoquinol methylase